MRKFALPTIVFAGLLLTSLEADARADREHIVISGGVSLMKWEKYKKVPHDQWWLNFIRAARIKIQDIQQESGPDARITWMVYRPAYSRRQREEPKPMFDIINSVKQKYNVNLVYFDEGRDVVNYLNTGRPRSSVKIQSLHYFGHSNRACFMFDYSSIIDSASKAWLHEDELRSIRRNIWASDAEVVSWGCHTGESFSQKWKSATGVPMLGAVGKTQYMTHELPVLSSPNGRWTD